MLDLGSGDGIAGALTFAECREGLRAAGFTDIEITPTFEAVEGMHSAIVRAAKPTEQAVEPGVTVAVALGPT